MMPRHQREGLRARAIVVVLAILAIAASGCLPLMVGSLGYEGYEYEKTGSLPGFPKMPSGDPSPSAQAQPLPSPAESNHDIE
jgi:hypothetical protein